MKMQTTSTRLHVNIEKQVQILVEEKGLQSGFLPSSTVGSNIRLRSSSNFPSPMPRETQPPLDFKCWG